MAVLVQDLVDDIRLLSNLKNNQFFSDQDIAGFASDAAKELADIFIAVNEHYLMVPFDFTLAGGVGANVAALPEDFQRSNILLRNPTQPNPERVRMLASLVERSTCNVFGPGFGRRYFISSSADGATLEMLPAPSAAGSYRLLYTPQLADLALSVPANETVVLAQVAPLSTLGTVTYHDGPGPGKSIRIIGAGDAMSIDGVAPADSSQVRVLIAGEAAALNNGLYRVSENHINGGGTFICTIFRVDDYDEDSEIATGDIVSVTGGNTFAGAQFEQTATPISIDVDPLTFVQLQPQQLPAIFAPWALYLKTHAAIAIRQARQQPTDDLNVKLTGLKLRAQKMAANRTEEVQQAPISTHRRGGQWGAGGDW